MAPSLPREFQFAGETYRAPRLSAWSQWEALQALRPALERGEDLNRSRRGYSSPRVDMQGPFTDAVNAIPPEDLSALFDLALNGVVRRTDDEWEPIWDPEQGVSLFDDLGAGRVILLVVRVLLESLSGYLSYKPVKFDRTSPDLNYSPVQMPDGQSWLFAPVERRMCLYESLFDGKLDLRDVARMNDLIAVSAENRARAQKAAEAEAAKSKR